MIKTSEECDIIIFRRHVTAAEGVCGICDVHLLIGRRIVPLNLYNNAIIITSLS